MRLKAAEGRRQEAGGMRLKQEAVGSRQSAAG